MNKLHGIAKNLDWFIALSKTSLKLVLVVDFESATPPLYLIDDEVSMSYSEEASFSVKFRVSFGRPN